jgi:iron complex outermembrane recepter protein
VEIFRLGYEPQKIVVMLPLESPLHIYLASQSILLQKVTVHETRAEDRKTPVTFSNMNRDEIKDKHFGQDIPMLLNEMLMSILIPMPVTLSAIQT